MSMQESNFSIKNIHNTFKNYLEISKPRSVILLYFTAFTSMLIASSIYGFDAKKLILISAAVILGVMGANATTNYIDRKIDAMMERTKKRAIASGKINPPKKGLVPWLSRTASCTRYSLSLSRLDVASSSSRMRGSLRTARAMATRWRCPPLSRTPRSPTMVS